MHSTLIGYRQFNKFFVDIFLPKVLEAESDDVLGSVNFKVSNLLDEPGMKTSENFPLNDCFTEGRLAVTLELKVS